MSEIMILGENDFKAIEVLGGEEGALADLIEANVGENMTIFDLPKITVPAGGSTFFSVKTSGGNKALEYLEGAILAIVRGKAYWSVNLDDSDENTPPDCKSDDAITGFGTPGGPCDQCDYNKFGSASKGAGKACKDRSMLLLLTKEGILPIMLQAPPTSLGALKEYGIMLSNEGRINWKTMTRIGLRSEKKSGKDTAILTFQAVGDIGKEIIPFVKNYRKNIDELIAAARKKMNEVGTSARNVEPEVQAPADSEAMPDFEAAE